MDHNIMKDDLEKIIHNNPDHKLAIHDFDLHAETE